MCTNESFCAPSVRGGTRMPGRNGEATPSAKRVSSTTHTHFCAIYIYINIYVCYGLRTVCAWWYSYAWQKRSSDSFCEESVEKARYSERSAPSFLRRGAISSSIS